jgi:type I restriction enzyme M protein
MERDWLEAIVQLPEQLFYNTGITTYIWVLTNAKEERRRGKVQLIDASSFWVPMRRSLGDKRRQISADQIARIQSMLGAFQETEHSKIMPATAFGYRRITVERPLRLDFQGSDERIERLRASKGFIALATSRKKEGAARDAEEGEGRQLQQAILDLVDAMPSTRFMARPGFVAALEECARARGVRLTAPVRKVILAALGERNEEAEVCLLPGGEPEADPELRDSENVALGEPVADYFEREVRPYVPDAWINAAVRDHRDCEIGKVGYEINFNRHFYVYTPPRPLAEIDAEIKALEQETLIRLQRLRT